MLFNSYVYLFAFLPATICVYFFLNKLKKTFAARVFLILASFIFYSWWNIWDLPVIIISVIFNYSIGLKLGKTNISSDRKRLFITGVSLNILLLIFYKYTDFLILNINTLLNTNINTLKLTLPLGISFFTITQIAYLSDAYRQTVKEYKGTNYSLFVAFFPHLLAGPILHHREMMPQFDRMRNKVFSSKNTVRALVLIVIGLIKKIAIADYLSAWADFGFDSAGNLSLLQAWITSLSYTLQIYFDFSGYTDMALGSALLLNIHLPLNFNSPYKSLNIREFWRAWHMTLSRFLRDYLYIPLGGNRCGTARVNLNIILTFILGGIWHGAGWGFLIWGALHGFAYAFYRLWQSTGLRLARPIAWFLTFNFINITWIFFRAKSFADAVKVIKGMVNFGSTEVKTFLNTVTMDFINLFQNKEKFQAISTLCNYFSSDGAKIMYLAILITVCVSCRNSNDISKDFSPNLRNALLFGFLGAVAIMLLHKEKLSKFLYFNF
ncbi:MAG: MBOAT family protein [Nitrospirae bacterium]|nr:MBOAT family protein [Nitrospirota bacterium]MBF0535104.1 MBOAT family protein [Nitrospirota bacterium]MBF0615346.1 MBOAT family protein [Nitrospirota bacterium]